MRRQTFEFNRRGSVTESIADKKTRIRRNQHLIRWIKENCCCRYCGARPPVKDLTFHHLLERRHGAPVLSSLVSKTTNIMVLELLKGVFLCRGCHEKEHRGE